MEKSDAIFGVEVYAPDRLVRHVDHARKREGQRAHRGGNWKGWVAKASRWSGIGKPQPVSGILIGIRYVHESGWREWQGEDGVSWDPEGPKRAQALVAEDLNHVPARVWLDDLRLARWTAPIAVEGRRSSDGRSIQPEAIWWESLPIALIDFTAQHVTEQIGTVDRIERTNDGLLVGSGLLTRDPSANGLAVSLDVREGDFEMLDDPAEMRTRRGRLWAVAISQSPAWPECTLSPNSD